MWLCVLCAWDQLERDQEGRERHTHTVVLRIGDTTQPTVQHYTAHSREDEIRNGHRNAKQSPYRNQETTILRLFSKFQEKRRRTRVSWCQLWFFWAFQWHFWVSSSGVWSVPEALSLFCDSPDCSNSEILSWSALPPVFPRENWSHGRPWQDFPSKKERLGAPGIEATLYQ